MGGKGERGVREGGGAASGSGGGRKTGGGEEGTGGGRETMASGGCHSSREGVLGTGVEDGRVIGGVPVASTEGGKAEGGGYGGPGTDWVYPAISIFTIFFFGFLLTIFLGKGDGYARHVHQQSSTAQCWGDTIKVSWKKTEDVEEGSSSGKKQKRKEDEEIEMEFGLMVEELWRRVVRKWEELEWQQEQRWAAILATPGHITEDVRELLDGLVPEEKEKGKEKGVEMEAEEMEMEETERDRKGQRRGHGG